MTLGDAVLHVCVGMPASCSRKFVSVSVFHMVLLVYVYLTGVFVCSCARTFSTVCVRVRGRVCSAEAEGWWLFEADLGLTLFDDYSTDECLYSLYTHTHTQRRQAWPVSDGGSKEEVR